MSETLYVSFLIVRNSYYCELNKHKIYDFQVHITACYDLSRLKYNKIYTIMVIISTNFMTGKRKKISSFKQMQIATYVTTKFKKNLLRMRQNYWPNDNMKFNIGYEFKDNFKI